MTVEEISDSKETRAVRSYNLTVLAKRLVSIANKNDLKFKVSFVEETLQSSPAGSALELLKDISAPLGLNYAVHSVSKLRDLAFFQNCFLTSRDDDIYYCYLDKNQNVVVEALSDGALSKYSLAEIKKLFSNSSLTVYAATDEPVKSVKQRLKFLNPFYGIGGGNFFWIAIASFFSNILGLATSLFIMVVYDRVLPNQASESLYALAFGVAIAVVFDQLLKKARSGIIEYSATASDQHISYEIFEQFVDVRVRSTGSVGSLSTIIKDFETYKDFVTSATILALIDLPFIFIFIYVISVVGADLYLIPLICIPIVIVGVLFLQPLLYRSSKRLSDANKSRQGYLVELLSGLDVLRINGAFAELRKRFVRESRNFSIAAARAKNLGQISGNIVYVVQQFSQVSVIVFGFHLFINQDITMGAIIATMILSGKTLAPLAKLAQTLSKLNSALIAHGNLKVFLSQRRKSIAAENGLFDVSHKQGLQIDNVTLRLSDGAKPVFTQLSLSIEQGEKVAIIGKSGSGKTSLIKLLCGLNEPEVGTAFVDGIDATCIDRADVFKKIGVCFQDPWIFAGSIRDNIALGNEGIADTDIINALLLAGGDALGNDLSSILDGICADRGSNLSGGQKQIIALARSFIFNADYLLLDEPTSSMDASMEAKVIENIRSKLAEKTIVLVTHKPNLLNACDRIIVLEAGRKVWDGTRDDYVILVNERKAAQ